MVGTPALPSVVYTDSLMDSRRWEHFVPRDGDIVVVTPPKSGTTWTQGLVALLLSGDPEVNADVSMKSPWIDNSSREVSEVMDRLEAQTQRRHVKSHTPFDGLPTWPELRYICVYRHPIDVYFSWRKHQANMPLEIGDVPAFEDPREGFRHFLMNPNRGTAGAIFQMIVHHYKTTLARDGHSNTLRLHYADMTRDLGAATARIAAHIGVEHPPEVMARLVEAASFANMKANPLRFAPGAGQDFWRDDSAFFESASSNKWEGVLAEDDLAEYDRVISGLLTPDERRWLEWGDAGA